MENGQTRVVTGHRMILIPHDPDLVQSVEDLLAHSKRSPVDRTTQPKSGDPEFMTKLKDWELAQAAKTLRKFDEHDRRAAQILRTIGRARVVSEIQTNSEGKFSIEVPAGAYLIVSSDAFPIGDDQLFKFFGSVRVPHPKLLILSNDYAKHSVALRLIHPLIRERVEVVLDRR
jgi:hypothetical protein